MNEPKFDAFISYSRHDRAAAQSFEKALRAYSPPKDLKVPQRRLRVFRDEADFTGTDYSKAISEHLGSSGALLVICSPNARKSRFVDEEVRLFAETMGPSRIIPLLIAGLPDNEVPVGQEELGAFPPSLCKALTMPLAIDYRGLEQRARVDRVPFEGAWHKLLADLYSVSRAELEQREKKRQAQVRRRWASGIGVVVTALAALTVWALISRAEAVRNREITAADLVVAQARELTGSDTPTIERRVLLAIESVRRQRARGADADAAFALLAESAGRLPLLLTSFAPEAAAGEDGPTLAFSTDGLRLFRVRKYALEVLQLSSMRIEHTFPLDRPLRRIATSPDGDLILGADAAGSVSWFDVGAPALEGSRAARKLFSDGGAVGGSRCEAISRDGQFWASWHEIEGRPPQVIVRSTITGAVVETLTLPAGAQAWLPRGSGSCLSFGKPGVSLVTPTIVLVTFSNSDSEATALTWHAAKCDPPSEYGLTVEDREPIRRWSDIVGVEWDSEGERLLVTRSGDVSGRSEMAEVPVGHWAERVASIPNERIGLPSPRGEHFATFAGFSDDPIVPLLNGTFTEIRDTIDGSVAFEVPGGGRFSTDGYRFIGKNGPLIRVWDVAGRREVFRIQSRQPVASVIDAPGGRYLALIGEDQRAEIWDTAHPQELIRIANATEGRLDADGERVLVTAAGGARLFDPKSGTVLGVADAAMVVGRSGSRGVGSRALWALDDSARTLWKSEGAIHCAEFSPGGERVAVADSERGLTLLDAVSGSPSWHVKLASRVERIRFSANGSVVAATLESEGQHLPGRLNEAAVVVLNAAAGSVIRQLTVPALQAFALDERGARLALADSKNGTVVYDLSTGDVTPPLKHPVTLETVADLTFVDSHRLASIAGSAASTFMGGYFFTEEAAFVWDLDRRVVVARTPPAQDRASDYPETLEEEEKPYLNGARLSGDGRTLAASVYASRLAYWALRSGRTTSDATVWSLARAVPHERLRIPGDKLVALSPNSTTVLLDGGGALKLWTFDRSRLEEAACARVSRNLDTVEWKTYFGDEPRVATCAGKP